MADGGWRMADGGWRMANDRWQITDCHAAINRFLRQGGIDDDVGGDPESRLVGVALAVEPRMSFQGTADVVLGIDDGPVAVDLDALELGEVLAAAGGLGVLRIGEVKADSQYTKAAGGGKDFP